MGAQPPTTARRVIYNGCVQGVGFRWTTRRIAQQYGVAGYVRNCPDGTVELFVQGADDEVTAMLDQLEVAMSGYIDQADIHEEPVRADLSSFSICR